MSVRREGGVARIRKDLPPVIAVPTTAVNESHGIQMRPLHMDEGAFVAEFLSGLYHAFQPLLGVVCGRLGAVGGKRGTGGERQQGAMQ